MSTSTSLVVSVDYRPSGRGGRTQTRPWAVTSTDGEVSMTRREDSRDVAMERAAALAGVKL